jgi:glucose/arabinose dehydrogenase
MASLEVAFYPRLCVIASSGPGIHPLPTKEDTCFPESYYDGAFAAEHGSWNRSPRAGYEVIHIPMHDGQATGEYEDFLTGFLTPDGDPWGRPVGVAVANDGSLFVTDDGSRSVWHVTYAGK